MGHDVLVSGQPVAVLSACGLCPDMGEIVTCLRFVQGDGERRLAPHQQRQQPRLLLGGTRLFDQTATQQNAAQERFAHQPLAEFTEQQRAVRHRATHAAVVLGERQGKPAHLGECLPMFSTVTRRVVAIGLTLAEFVVGPDEPVHAIAQHQLLFGKLEIHRPTSTAVSQ